MIERAGLLADPQDPFLRERLEGHFTGGCWLVSADGRRILMTHHRKLGRWLQKPFHTSQKAVSKSGSAGRKGRGKMPL